MVEKHHIYLLSSGRVNMCGLNTGNVNKVAEVSYPCSYCVCNDSYWLPSPTGHRRCREERLRLQRLKLPAGLSPSYLSYTPAPTLTFVLS